MNLVLDEEELVISTAKLTAPQILQAPSNQLADVEADFSYENFNKFIMNSAENFSQLTDRIREISLTSLNIRVNVWRILLGVFSANSNNEAKRESIMKSRAIYAELTEKYKPKAQNADVNKPKPVFNPLAKNIPTNPYSGYFEDNELRTEIKKDVDRTYQDRPLFNENKVKQILSNVLFVFSKKNSDVSYKQGMNEIAASFLIIYLKEAVFVSENSSESNACKNVSAETVEFAKVLLNMEYAEADIYTMFARMMEIGHLEMFRPSLSEDNKKKQEYNVNSKKQQAILMRIGKIQDHYLKTVDMDLFKHMKLLGVEFQIFLLRWIRCVHTREYHLDDSFTLWDNIFLEYSQNPVADNNFFLIDCICLAMMEYVRTQLLEKEEHSQCLSRFLKYPPVEEIKMIVDMAFTIKDILTKVLLDKESESGKTQQQKEQAQVEENKVVKSMQQGNKNLILFSTGFTNKSTSLSTGEVATIPNSQQLKPQSVIAPPVKSPRLFEAKEVNSKVSEQQQKQQQMQVGKPSGPAVMFASRKPEQEKQQESANLAPVILSSSTIKSMSTPSTAPTQSQQVTFPKSNPIIAFATNSQVKDRVIANQQQSSVPIQQPAAKVPIKSEPVESQKETTAIFKSTELNLMAKKMSASLDYLNGLLMRDMQNDELRKVIDDMQFVEQELKKKAVPSKPVFANAPQPRPVLFTTGSNITDSNLNL